MSVHPSACNAEPALLPQGGDPGSETMAGVSGVAADLETNLPHLTSGMSTGLRNKVEAAIAELGALGLDSGKQVSLLEASPTGRHAGRSCKTPTQRELQLEMRVKQLEDKLALSRSIMRKLYQTNVSLCHIRHLVLSAERTFAWIIESLTCQ